MVPKWWYSPRWPLESIGKLWKNDDDQKLPNFHWKYTPKIHWMTWGIFPTKPLCGQGCQDTPWRSHDIPGNATAPLWCVVQCLNPFPERYQKNIQNPFAASRPLLSDFFIFFGEHRATKSIPQTRLTSGFVQIAIYPWAHRSSLKRLQTISAQPRLCGNGITSLIWFPAAAAATGHMIIKIIDIVWPLQVSRQFSCFIWSVGIVPSACLRTILTTIL